MHRPTVPSHRRRVAVTIRAGSSRRLRRRWKRTGTTMCRRRQRRRSHRSARPPARATSGRSTTRKRRTGIWPPRRGRAAQSGRAALAAERPEGECYLNLILIFVEYLSITFLCIFIISDIRSNTSRSTTKTAASAARPPTIRPTGHSVAAVVTPAIRWARVRDRRAERRTRTRRRAPCSWATQRRCTTRIDPVKCWLAD